MTTRFLRAALFLAWLTVPGHAASLVQQQSLVSDVPTGQLQPTAILPETVPYRNWNGLIVLFVVLQDGLPQQAVLATGLPICLVSPALSARAGAQASGPTDVLLMDRRVKAAHSRPINLRIARVGMMEVPAAVLDAYSALSGASDPLAPGVWLGNSFLAATSVTVDPVKQQITFRRPADPLPSKAVLVPFELRDGRPWVEIKINGKKTISALVDTAASGILLPADAAKELELTPIATVPATLPDGKEGKVSVAELSDVDLSGAKVTGVRAMYVAESTKDAIDPHFAVIGSDVLLRYRLTICYRDRKLALEKVKLPAPPAEKQGPAVLPTGATPPGTKRP